MTISYDDKLALLDRLPARDVLAFQDPPVAAKVYPEESWTTYVDGESIYLKYNGGKVKRQAKAA